MKISENPVLLGIDWSNLCHASLFFKPTAFGLFFIGCRNITKKKRLDIGLHKHMSPITPLYKLKEAYISLYKPILHVIRCRVAPCGMLCAAMLAVWLAVCAMPGRVTQPCCRVAVWLSV